MARPRPRLSLVLLFLLIALVLPPLRQGLPAVPVRAATASYTITDLGTFGGVSSRALGINNRGQVVGSFTLPAGTAHAFRWQNGTWTDLGDVPGGVSNVEAFAINDAGQVVGVAIVRNPDFSNQIVDAQHAFLWQNSVMTDLGTLGGPCTCLEAVAVDINALGQIVGSSDGMTPAIHHPFLWQNGVMTDLGTPGVTFDEAYAINDLGQVVGIIETTEATFQVFLWQQDTMTNLDPLNTSHLLPLGINTSGQVVGSLDRGIGRHAFLWQQGAITDLGTLSNATTSEAYAINRVGDIVGVAGSRAVVWRQGAILDLNSVIPTRSGWSLTTARDINDVGQIVGWGLRNGQTHAFLLTPSTMSSINLIRPANDRRNMVVAEFPGTGPDGVFTVDARLVGDTAGRYVAIGCRFNVRDNKLEGYRVRIEPDRREFRVDRIVLGSDTPIVPTQVSNGIRRGTAINHVELRCAGCQSTAGSAPA